MKILLVYAPFCTPASPPYSLAHLASFLKNNSSHEISVLDLNILFHKEKFADFQEYFKSMKWDDYDKMVKEYNVLTKNVYSENNKKIVAGEKPALFSTMLDAIREQQADVVAFSLVYNSQAFYARALLEELRDCTTVIGGPCVNEKLTALANHTFAHEIAFLEFLEQKEISHDSLSFEHGADFSCFALDHYFVPKTVIPLRTSSTCFYKQCTFCSHYNKVPYDEFSLDSIRKTIQASGATHFFLIDDMIPVKRLLDIGAVMKEHGAYWTCQLRPTKDFTPDVLKELYACGLRMVIWGVESGSQRVLDMMKKGTQVENVEHVLRASHEAGIVNVTYIMFGFPTATKEDFLSTIAFLERNKEYISLVSEAVFGLQHGTPIYNDPASFGITSIEKKERTVLEPKITYSVSSGMSHEEAVALRKKYRKTLDSINSFPKAMNFFREHMLCMLSK